jgi:hypothetical protein
MCNEEELLAVAKTARTLFRSGIAESPELERLGQVVDPIPIRESDGAINSWFVAIQIRDKLAGYLQLTRDLVLMRYASFWRGESGFKSCPDSASWLDSSRIMEKARRIARPSESLGEPYLSYDKNPSRIAWAVTTRDTGDVEDIIFVVGDPAFRRAGDNETG